MATAKRFRHHGRCCLGRCRASLNSLLDGDVAACRFGRVHVDHDTACVGGSFHGVICRHRRLVRCFPKGDYLVGGVEDGVNAVIVTSSHNARHAKRLADLKCAYGTRQILLFRVRHSRYDSPDLSRPNTSNGQHQLLGLKCALGRVATRPLGRSLLHVEWIVVSVKKALKQSLVVWREPFRRPFQACTALQLAQRLSAALKPPQCREYAPHKRYLDVLAHGQAHGLTMGD